MNLMQGDCLKMLKNIPAATVDSIITDPPYGLSFMGKRWDYDVPSVDIWKECLRVLKPGGHLLAFGGTRTYHRLVVAIEDAGFEIRDQIQWIYGQGFPKSQDISKAIDKAAGAEREVVCVSRYAGKNPNGHQTGSGMGKIVMSADVTAPATPDAQKWSGWGTALKPANEPICLARKPLSESTIAKNVLKWGTGGLNIDGSRIGVSEDDLEEMSGRSGKRTAGNVFESKGDGASWEPNTTGRFPANVIFDEDAAKALDGQTEHLHGAGSARKAKRECGETESMFGMGAGDGHRFGDSGGASRFFYVAKASKSDRGEGNIHPTVKPIKLMEYLIKLVTPEGGVVLDPFMGSGTTGVAAKNLKFHFTGIELLPEHFEICKSRMNYESFEDFFGDVL